MNQRSFPLLALLVALFWTSSLARAAQIIADPSDYEAFSNNGIGDSTLTDMGVGDTGSGSPNLGRRSLVKFSLAGLAGATIQSATLNLYIIESRKDQSPDPGVITSSPPFVNPGLGNTLVVHIADYGVPSAAAYNSVSIGSDPGILIDGATQPAAREVSINAKSALQQAINGGFPFVTFRIQTINETDGDSLNDLWFFASGNSVDPTHRPFVEFSAVPEPSAALVAAGGLGLTLCAGMRRRYAALKV